MFSYPGRYNVSTWQPAWRFSHFLQTARVRCHCMDSDMEIVGILFAEYLHRVLVQFPSCWWECIMKVVNVNNDDAQYGYKTAPASGKNACSWKYSQLNKFTNCPVDCDCRLLVIYSWLWNKTDIYHFWMTNRVTVIWKLCCVRIRYATECRMHVAQYVALWTSFYGLCLSPIMHFDEMVFEYQLNMRSYLRFLQL
jgi:hypothetical protein